MKSLELAQQAWLQGLLSHRIVTVKGAKEMHKAAILAVGEQYNPTKYGEFTSVVGRAISRIGLEMRRTRDEASGKEVLMIVNTNGDERAQLATQFTPREIAFIKLLIGDIFTAPKNAYSLSKLAAAGVGFLLDPQMSASKVESLCTKLVRQGWLREEDAYYSLSPRSLMELQGYLRGAYEEHVHPCTVCQDMVTLGYTCAQANCDAWVHQFCLRSYESDLRKESGVAMCRLCEEAWKPIKVGERDTSRTARQPVRRRESANDIRNRLQAQGARGSEGSESTPATRDSRRSSGRLAKRRRTTQSEEEEEQEEGEGEEDDDEEIEDPSTQSLKVEEDELENSD